MSQTKKESHLARAIARFLAHKRALGNRYRQEAWLLQRLGRFVRESAEGAHRDLDAKCFACWLMSLQDRHPNTRRKWYQIVRHFCCYRRRSEPRCFLPSAEGAARRQPYVMPVIIDPRQIARMIRTASKLPNTSASPLRASALRLAIVLLYTCGLRLGEPMTRFGVRYLLRKHLPKRLAGGAAGLSKRLHPHSLRHTTAVYVLNVIEDPAERLEALVDAFHHAKRLLVVAGLIKETVDTASLVS